MHTIRDWFEAAIALPPLERRRFLAERCTDAGVRRVVERLVDAHEHADTGPLSLDALHVAAKLEPELGAFDATSWIDRPIGAYRIRDVLGEGGSSIVFRAERSLDGILQQFAIKVLRKSLLSAEEQRRFRQERLALAALSHPNIAGLLDGGVTEGGLPYIVLELVEGSRITEYARAVGLDVRARVRLLISVCRTVEAAHRALIVHRDLKPANVLVTERGVVKLLDFGIAKFLDDADDATATVYRAMTPAYAAPEQFTGAPITTATDVFALGVLMYELLTGGRPDADTVRSPSAQVSRTISETGLAEPVAQVRRELRGDLDNIALKAVEADPERRYASAGAMADDLERYLASEPVLAHPPSRWYRARKFFARNALPAAVVTLASIGVLVSLSVALWQASAARAEAQRARAVSTFMTSIFEAAQAELPRSARPSVEDLVGAAQLRIANDTTLAPQTRADLLLALIRVAVSIHDVERAEAMIASALPLIEGGAADSAQRRVALAALRGRHLVEAAKYPEAVAVLIPHRERIAVTFDWSHAEAGVHLSQSLADVGRRDEAAALMAQMYAMAMKRAAEDPKLAQEILIADANSLVAWREFRQGLERCEAALAFVRRERLPPSNAQLWMHESIANAASSLGDPVRAERAYRDALALADDLYDRPHPDTAWMQGVFGSFLVSRERFAEAEPFILRGLEMRRALLGESHPNTIFAMTALARLRTGQLRRAEAIVAATQAIDACRRDKVAHHACARALSFRATLLSNDALTRADAHADIDAALTLQRTLSGEHSPHFGSLLTALAEVLSRSGDSAGAIDAADRALAIANAAKGGYWSDVLFARYWRARALFDLGRNDEALAEIVDVDAKFAAEAPDSARRFPMLALKAMALTRAQRESDAVIAARAALDAKNKPEVIEPDVLASLQRIAARD